MVEGPFGRNVLYLDTVQELTGRPVLLPTGAGGSAVGAARLAAMDNTAPPRLRPHPPCGERRHALLHYAETWRTRLAARP